MLVGWCYIEFTTHCQTYFTITRPSNTTLNNTKRHLNNTVIYCHNSVATINNIAKWLFFQNFGKKWRFFQNFEFFLENFKILKKKLAKNNVFFMAKNDDFFSKFQQNWKNHQFCRNFEKIFIFCQNFEKIIIFECKFCHFKWFGEVF